MEERKKEIQDIGNRIKDSIRDAVYADEDQMVLEDMKKRMIISLVFTVPLMIVAVLTYAQMWGIVIEIALLIPVVVVNLRSIRSGVSAVKDRRPERNLLALIAAAAAVVLMQFAGAGLILSAAAVCRYFECFINCRLDEHLKDLIMAEIQGEEFQPGDEITVGAGERIPADGVITGGISTVDEDLITGVRTAPEKREGDFAFAGTKVVTGEINVRVKRTGRDTVIRRIIDHITEAVATKAPISRKAEKSARTIVGIVLALAVITGLVWASSGVKPVAAALAAISILVIANPYAISVGVPMSVLAATVRGAENGILIRSADILESTRDINTVIMNKTGTITFGNPQISDVMQFSDGFTLRLAGALERGARHPVGRAIYRAACGTYEDIPAAEKLEYIPGRGVRGRVDGTDYLAGNTAFMSENGISLNQPELEPLIQQGKNIIYFANSSRIIGAVALRDVPKPSSIKAITRIEGMGINVVMLTGDSFPTAQALKEEVGIDDVYAEILPGKKGEIVEQLREEKDVLLAMVGDGVYDADAISKADLGIAIGTGRDINIAPADIVLITDDLMDVVRAVRLSRLANRSIRQSIYFGIIYNILAIIFAAVFLIPMAGPVLGPPIAAFCMCASQFLVVLNTLRLKQARL